MKLKIHVFSKNGIYQDTVTKEFPYRDISNYTVKDEINKAMKDKYPGMHLVMPGKKKHSLVPCMILANKRM